MYDNLRRILMIMHAPKNFSARTVYGKLGLCAGTFDLERDDEMQPPSLERTSKT